MAVHTVLMDFTVMPSLVENEKEKLVSSIVKILRDYLPDIKPSHKTETGTGFLSAFTASRDTYVTVRGFPNGLVTINIEYFKNEDEEPLLKFVISPLSGKFSSEKWCHRIEKETKYKRFATSTEVCLNHAPEKSSKILLLQTDRMLHLLNLEPNMMKDVSRENNIFIFQAKYWYNDKKFLDYLNFGEIDNIPLEVLDFDNNALKLVSVQTI